MSRVPRSPRDPVLQTVVQFLDLKARVEQETQERDRLRDELKAYVETTHDVTDVDGHQYRELSSPVTVAGKTYKTLKRERRVSTTLNEDRLLELAHEKGFTDRVIKTMEYVDQDEIYVLYQEGKLTEEELDSLFDRNITWAFRPIGD